MKRFPLTWAVVALVAAACSDTPLELPRSSAVPLSLNLAPSAVCGSSSVTLLAGQHTPAGTVTVANDETHLYVTLTTTGGWTLAESHIAAGASLSAVPRNKPGSPQPGKFPAKASHAPGTTAHTAAFALADLGVGLGGQVVVAAHADVANGSQSEGAWGEGTRFVTSTWAMYSTHAVAECIIDVLVVSNRPFDNATVVNALAPLMPDVTFTSTTDASELTPAYLSSFRAVLLFENGLSGDGPAKGNALAAYIGSGGNLVIGTFYWQNRSDNPGYGFYNTGWGALEGLDPLQAPAYEYRSATVDMGSIIPHPLTAGVGPLTVSCYPNAMAAKPGTTVVAWFTDGAPFISYVEHGLGQRVVAVAAFPPHPSYCPVSGDHYGVFVNAIEWAAGGSTPAPMSALMASTPLNLSALSSPFEVGIVYGGTEGIRNP